MNEYIGKDGRRILFSIAIPGFVAFLPWGIIILKKFQIDSTVNGSVLNSLVIILTSLAIGLILHDIGSRIEVLIDKTLSAFCKYEIEKYWEAYLGANQTENQRIRLKYISEIVDRFRFELNTVPAIVFSFLGFRELGLINNWGSETFWCCVFLPHLSVLIFLILEAFSSAILLHKQRQKNAEAS